MSTKREELIDWLRDAYAMERGLETTLGKQVQNEDMPELLREQARVHLEETKAHAEAVKACLQQLGTDTSALKTGVAQAMEMAKGFGTNFARDERVKDLLMAVASEHFEIACYRALRVGAELAGEPGIVAVCDRIIPDDQRMAYWLAEYRPMVVGGYLREETTAST
jgi:ferritin-like metal-binding protein YciE